MVDKTVKTKVKKVVAEPKAVKKTAAKTSVAKKATNVTKKEVVASTIPARTHGDLTVNVLSTTGEVSGKMELPASVFGAKINKQLMAQAIRVHMANKRAGTASTKTQSDVSGSTRKIYKQKGTGNARHGAIRASIFVKGGVALGPKPYDHGLDFPKKMKKAALTSAFTSQLVGNSIKIVADFKNLELKTKAYAEMFQKLECFGRTLMVISKDELEAVRAIRNIDRVDVISASDVHTYAVLMHKYVTLTKKAVSELETRLATQG